jgi:hypothetical protein
MHNVLNGMQVLVTHYPVTALSEIKIEPACWLVHFCCCFSFFSRVSYSVDSDGIFLFLPLIQKRNNTKTLDNLIYTRGRGSPCTSHITLCFDAPITLKFFYRSVKTWNYITASPKHLYLPISLYLGRQIICSQLQLALGIYGKGRCIRQTNIGDFYNHLFVFNEIKSRWF